MSNLAKLIAINEIVEIVGEMAVSKEMEEKTDQMAALLKAATILVEEIEHE